MNTTTKFSLGATVVLLVIALIIAVQNMTELKSAHQLVAAHKDEIDRLRGELVKQRRRHSLRARYESQAGRP